MSEDKLKSNDNETSDVQPIWVTDVEMENIRKFYLFQDMLTKAFDSYSSGVT